MDADIKEVSYLKISGIISARAARTAVAHTAIMDTLDELGIKK
jgi:hypothetical protein